MPKTLKKRMIDNIGRGECAIIRNVLESNLNAQLPEYGLKHSIGKMTYSTDGDQVTLKLTISLAGALSEEAKALAPMLKSYGLIAKASDGAEIVGYNHKAPKYPWIVKRGDDQFKFTTQGVRRNFKDPNAKAPVAEEVTDLASMFSKDGGVAR